MSDQDEEPSRAPPEPSSEVEIRALWAAANHDSLKEAAAAIHVGFNTLNWQLNSMRRRYGVRSTPHLVELAYEQHWLPPSDVPAAGAKQRWSRQCGEPHAAGVSGAA